MNPIRKLRRFIHSRRRSRGAPTSSPDDSTDMVNFAIINATLSNMDYQTRAHEPSSRHSGPPYGPHHDPAQQHASSLDASKLHHSPATDHPSVPGRYDKQPSLIPHKQLP